jgi:hypothetical protein
MHDLQSITEYNIFKCLFPDCNKNIPVESFLTRYNYATATPHLQNKGIDVVHDLIAIDVICPFCSHPNHFRIMDREREISKQEYNAQRYGATWNSSRIVYKVKIPADSATLAQPLEYPP